MSPNPDLIYMAATFIVGGASIIITVSAADLIREWKWRKAVRKAVNHHVR